MSIMKRSLCLFLFFFAHSTAVAVALFACPSYSDLCVRAIDPAPPACLPLHLVCAFCFTACRLSKEFGYDCVVMVGDGATDMQVKSLALRSYVALALGYMRVTSALLPFLPSFCCSRVHIMAWQYSTFCFRRWPFGLTAHHRGPIMTPRSRHRSRESEPLCPSPTVAFE